MFFEMPTGLRAAVAGVASLLLCANPAAAELSDVDGAAARIDMSGKLRMLSQKVVAEACYVRAGIVTDRAWPSLVLATDEFTEILEALVFGNEKYGLMQEEERPKTQLALGLLAEGWMGVEQEARMVASGATDAQSIVFMAEQSGPLLGLAQDAVSEISGQYAASSTLLQSDAMIIDIAGRQRMLAQQISKNACLLGTGLGDMAAVDALNQSMQIYEASLFALINGMPSAGIAQPPTQDISDSLNAVATRWNALQPTLAAVAADADQDRTVLATIAVETAALTTEMNDIVAMYTADSNRRR